jgi:uncharacterized protein (DUF58 family)
LPTTVLVDASASMAYPVETSGKWTLARSLGVGLAAVAQATGDPVGVTVVSGTHVVVDISPTTRRGIIPVIAGALGGVTPGVTQGAGFRRTIEAIGTRGRVIVIGDFLQQAEETLARVRGVIGYGGEVYAVHVVATEELHPPTRALLVSDPENSEFRRPLTGETRRAYQEGFGEWRESLRHNWQAAGASYVMVPTDEPAIRALRRVVRS